MGLIQPMELVLYCSSSSRTSPGPLIQPVGPDEFDTPALQEVNTVLNGDVCHCSNSWIGYGPVPIVTGSQHFPHDHGKVQVCHLIATFG